MGIFDPAATNKQIDNVLAGLEPGKRFSLVADADLGDRSGRAAIIIRISDDVKGYVRVTKKLGQPIGGDAGVSISFLADVPDDTFTYEELVELLRARGFGPLKAHWQAYRLFNGQAVTL
jgi:hypothetical protein